MALSKKENQRLYRQRHPERRAASRRRWYATHRDQALEKGRLYRKTHIRSAAAHDRSRRDLRQQVPTFFTSRVSALLRHPEKYAEQALGIRLRPYQAEPLERILESIEKHLGDSFVIIFPRQSGKDEFLLDLILYLADLYSVLPVGIVAVNPTYSPQTENAMQRFDRLVQSNILTRGQWRNYGGHMRILGEMHVTFLSGDKKASVAGATASLLLIINEAQDISPRLYSQKFEPMVASTNATRIFAGTAWTSRTLLAEEKRAAQAAERLDKRKRVFMIDADKVSQCVPWYGHHVQAVVRKLGRQHPMVKTQYFNEEIDAQGSMFNAARRALMKSDAPSPNRPGVGESHESPRALYGEVGHAFCIDVGGMDEANIDSDGMGNPGRDSTTLSIAEIDLSTLATLQAPTFRIVHRLAWTGINHVTIGGKIKALAEAWRPKHIVIDATGVGEGLWSMLDKAFPTKVIPVKFSAQKKSDIGYRFLALIETGRFKDCATDDLDPATIDRQYAACVSEILPGPQKTMRWGVPDGTRDENGDLIHDDIVLADSLVAELDVLDWTVHSPTLIVPAVDPLEEMSKIKP